MRAHAHGAIVRALTCVRAASLTYVGNYLGSNVCPAGYSKITTDAGCEAAGASLGYSYYGNFTYPAYPSGCFIEPSGARLNLDPIGAGYSALRPLCQISGAPPQTATRRPPEGPPWYPLSTFAHPSVLPAAAPNHRCAAQTAPWEGRARCRCRCGRGESSVSRDVGGVSPCASQSRCRCGRGELLRGIPRGVHSCTQARI